MSWTAPVNLDGGILTGYTTSASPGGETCATAGATTCTLTDLANGTTYSITVVTRTSVGESGASATATVTPQGVVAFTSDPDYTAAFGSMFSFTVMASGSPAPTITEPGRLPPGVRFTAGKAGTATISGTPAGSAAGLYALTLTAKNKSATAEQAFTLTIDRVGDAAARVDIHRPWKRDGSAHRNPFCGQRRELPDHHHCSQHVRQCQPDIQVEGRSAAGAPNTISAVLPRPVRPARSRAQ